MENRLRLYRHTVNQELGDTLELVCSSNNLESLQRQAEALAKQLGCYEFSWLSGSDSNPFTQFPWELEVEEICTFVIRDW